MGWDGVGWARELRSCFEIWWLHLFRILSFLLVLVLNIKFLLLLSFLLLLLLFFTLLCFSFLILERFHYFNQGISV